MDVAQSARDAFRRRQWDEARELFRACGQVDLSAGDLASWAVCAWWLGLVDESVERGEAAFRAYLAAGGQREAAGQAIGIAVNHFLRGEEAPGSGWLGRAAALLADDPECTEAGYLRYLTEVESALAGPDPDSVIASARGVADLGRRLGDPNLMAAGAVGEGRVLVKQGRTAEGLALLDRALVAVQANELAADWAGNIYCHMIAACHELADVRRAKQWTESLERWLCELPAAVVFTGVCRLHRSQIMHVLGDWDRAEQDAVAVCGALEHIYCATAADGHYLLGELHRLRGRHVEAESAYHRAHRLGRDPQPGLALLRSTQGQFDSAVAAIRAALIAEPNDRLTRALLCAAQVEIALAAGDGATATRASAELTDTATEFGSPGLRAVAERAAGAILLADGNATAALPLLREACRRWVELAAPYECARTRVLLAATYHELGDAESADREQVAAGEVFTVLGVGLDGPALATRARDRSLPGGLTDREAEVLGCLANGGSNKQIAAALAISDKTVQRHLSNIFTKLGLTSRTAAAAYAFEHGLVPGHQRR